MRIAVALAALLCAAPATPQVVTGPNTRYFSGMPPLKYQGEGAAIVIFVNDVTKFCGVAPEGLQIIACARTDKNGTPYIFMPHPASYAYGGDYYAKIMAHELAHTRGWGADHPL